MENIITTAKGARFDISRPAKSSVITVLNENGNSIMDELRLTGRFTAVEMFGEKTSMIEVEHSFGTDEVCEDYLWQ